MATNNKLRILKLLEILKKYSDMEHKLSLTQINDLLVNEDLETLNRKTLYDDLKILNQAGYEVEYDNGYYLTEAPFTLSEIKIIIDSLNSLKNLDDKFLNNLNNKLYSFLSDYEVKLLQRLEYHNKHSNSKFINRLEDTLNAIKLNKTIIIKRKNKDKEEICPLFLYRHNDYYYLYYNYPNKDKIYHCRFDNISNILLSENNINNTISKNKIIETINESTNAFYSKQANNIKFEIINDSPYLRSRLLDDYPNITFTKDGFVLKASINDAFFAKLTTYNDDIKISDKDIAYQYIEFLNKIITRNKDMD